MKITTSKDQTITGKDADTVAALAVVGTVAIVGASAAAVAVGFISFANRIGTGSWKIKL